MCHARVCLLGGVSVLLVCLLAAQAATGATVVWDVDPADSFIRLTIPDQLVPVSGLGDVTVRVRDANDNSQWTDAGGRRAALDGEINTEYINFTSIQFVGGTPGLYALEQTNLRPDPAQWDPIAANYTGTATAPAALGGRIRGTFLLTFDGGFVAFRSVALDIASGVIPLGPGGTFGGNLTQFGLPFALIDADGLELPLGLGQPIPDLLHEQSPAVAAVNAGGGTIENLGGPHRKLTYQISAPLAFQLDTVVLTGTATGQIVAYATIPPPLIPFDYLGDGDVDRTDFIIFQVCATRATVAGLPPGCTAEAFAISDFDQDLDVDMDDFGAFQRCYSGENVAPSTSCGQ